MKNEYSAPEYMNNAFNCPHCNAFAHQEFMTLCGTSGNDEEGYEEYYINDYFMALCSRCNDFSIWRHEKLIYPKNSKAPLPLEDMPSDVKEDYIEARNIVNESPRAAAALLRLGLEKLMPYLGETESNQTIDQKIGNLVKEGLPVEIQQSLDSLRVIGNESVHPGELNLKDDIDTALSLFEVLNFIIDRMISQPKKIKGIFDNLPDSKKEGIKNRDKKVLDN